jgi:serine/threonine protein kinase
VYKGIWQGITEVALKQLTTSESEALLNEIKLLKEFNHPNIVRYFGVYKSPKNMFVMMEYMAQGDVSTLLQNNKQTYQIIDLLSMYATILYYLSN